MFLPQFLNYQRFLRRRRSSSKTKACKFLVVILRTQPLNLCQQILFYFFWQLL